MLINLLKLVSFVRAVDYQSFSKAALSLGISTPAVSKQIKDLEKFMNVKLLQRSTRKISLTESGEKAYEHFTGMLVDLNSLYNDLQRNNPNPYIKKKFDKIEKVYKENL